jgi:beta-lactamase regulating signal transducer with metallopeptidase domain
MKFTFFSFVMAVIWSGVLFSIIALLQKNARTIRYLSIKMIFAVYIVSIFRFLFPVEFPFTVIVGDRELYAPIYRALCLDTYSIGSWEFSLVHVVVVCWLIGSIIHIYRFYRRYRNFWRQALLSDRPDETQQQQLDRVWEQLSSQKQCQKRFLVRYTNLADVPMGFGVRRPIILLPKAEYTDTEMYYILLHECSHFSKRDSLIKIAMEFLCDIFWWNVSAGVVRESMDEMLEIRCDTVVMEKAGYEQKRDYLDTLKNSLYRMKELQDSRKSLTATSLLTTDKKKQLSKRFALIADPPKELTGIRKAVSWVAFTVVMGGTLLLSYSFIWQPAYDTPRTEIMTDNTKVIYESTPDNTWLLVDEENCYYITGQFNGSRTEISFENAQRMIEEGFRVENID